MKSKNYYEILEVTSHADQTTIKKAYQILAHKFHPDISIKPDAELRFKEINEAYNVLKDSHKRFIYDSANFKLVTPHNSYSWFTKYFSKITKQHSNLHITDKRNKDNMMQSTQKIPLLSMGIFVLILSAIIIVILFAIEQVGQKDKQIQNSILQGDKVAITTLENMDIETQAQILANKEVSQAVVNFYLKQTDKPIFSKLETYDHTIEAIILANVYSSLIDYYKPIIQHDIENDNFNKALSLLEIFKNKYPNSPDLIALDKEVKNKKQQRLAILTKEYVNCLEKTLEPLLDKINCIITTRKKIIHIGTSLPADDPNLQAMYIEAIKYSFAEKNYQQAEKLLSEWNDILSNPSEAREQLQYSLSLHQQRKEIIADLSNYDKEKIIKRLNQLTVSKTLQAELFIIPEVQNNLLRYHIDEALELMLLKEDVKIKKKTIVMLEQLLSMARNSNRTAVYSSTPWYKSSNPKPVNHTKPEIVSLLQKCRKHFEANRLTTGGSGTALSCYNKVLKKDSGNLDAKAGLRAIEKRYKLWMENALQRNKLNKAKTYLAGLERVAPKSEITLNLKERLQKAMLKVKAKPKIIPKRISSSIPVKPIKLEISEPVKAISCDGCSCSKLLKQLSMGVKPLTKIQDKFFQEKCH
ncbi:MAG TPA: hypothetical protein ENK59_03595 [Thioploca sp.]|nr:hypothetical protein [Thioploca sp.]